MTGGCGFIGYHLCRRLLSEGNFVVCFDNLSSGSVDNLKLLKEFGGSRFDFYQVDLADNQLPMFLEPFSEIYHLACPASPVQYMKDPIHTLRTCFEGTRKILELARGYGGVDGCRVVFTSTSEVYGDPLEHPQREEYFGNVNPCGPRACYDEGKRVAETLCYEYARTSRVDVRVVRLFNTYGPRMAKSDGRVIGNFIEAISAGRDLELHNHGRQTRSFCYVDDTVEALIRIMRLPDGDRDHPLERFGPYNIGNPHEVTILELAETLGRVMGVEDIGYRLLPAREDDPTRRRPDISRLNSVTGWEPVTPLEVGLRRMVDSWD